jgi:hypothetical protein
VVVHVGDERWALGSGPAVASVGAGRFELFRSLGGRRSEAQLRSLPWTGAVEDVLPVFSAYPPPGGDLFDGPS